ncbi:paeninodin family lasso peptide [Bacillus dakarensis]|nr:paeninodin family lasso peptide [Bacillus dakarensis]
MKKEWEKPILEVLEVKMTLLGKYGDRTDAEFPAETDRGDLTFHS